MTFCQCNRTAESGDLEWTHTNTHVVGGTERGNSSMAPLQLPEFAFVAF